MAQLVSRQVEVELEDGDLVVMGGTCQRTHKHAVPPSAKRNGSYLAEYTQFYRWKVDSSNMSQTCFFWAQLVSFFNALYMFFFGRHVLAAPCCKGRSASLSGAFRASRAEAESCWKWKNCVPQQLDAARWYTHVLHLIFFFSKFIYNVGSCWFRLQLVFSKLYGTISIIYTYINVNHCNLIVILQVISHIYHISHISHISLIYLLYISYISYRYIIPYSVEDFPERLCSLCQALLKSWSPVMPRDLKAQKLALFSSDFQCHNMF